MRSSSFRLSSRRSLTRVLSLSISSIPVSPVRRRKSTSSVGIYGLVMMKVSIPQILYIGWYERQICQIVMSDGYWMEIYTSFFCGISLCKDTKACRYMQIINIFLLIINRLFTFQGTTNESTSCVLLHQLKWIIVHPCSFVLINSCLRGILRQQILIFFLTNASLYFANLKIGIHRFEIREI